MNWRFVSFFYPNQTMKIAFSTPVQKITAVGIVAAVLLSVITSGYYLLSQNPKQISQNIPPTPKKQLHAIYNQLDSISGELADHIETVSTLGGEVDSLTAFRKQLEAEKYNLKLKRNVDSAQIVEMTHKINHYEKMLGKKAMELVILKQTVADLESENKALRTERDSLKAEVSETCTQKELLEEKLNIAKRLKADNFELQGFDKTDQRNNEKGLFAKRVAKLAVRFRIKENVLVDPASKKVYIRIVEPDDLVLFDAKNSPHHFKIQGREDFCTTVKNIFYESNDVQVDYLFEKGNPFKQGKHKLEIYCDDHLIGEHSFTIK